MHKDYNWELITGWALRSWICDLILTRPAGGWDVRLSPTSSAIVWRCRFPLTWKWTHQMFKHQASFPSHSRAKMGYRIAWGSFFSVNWFYSCSACLRKDPGWLPEEGREGKGVCDPSPRHALWEASFVSDMNHTLWNLKSLTVLNLYDSYWFPSILFS